MKKYIYNLLSKQAKKETRTCFILIALFLCNLTAMEFINGKFFALSFGIIGIFSALYLILFIIFVMSFKKENEEEEKKSTIKN